MAEPRPNCIGSSFLAAGRVLIGMVHVGATPGTPRASQSPAQLVEQAAREAQVLREAGFDAVIVENMHDAPYVQGEALGPEQTAVMALAAQAVREAFGGPVGVQILSGGSRQAMAVAHVAGGSFIRCENFVFAHVADEGLLPRAEAGPLLRYRRQIGAGDVAILADIKKKHASHAITSDIDISEAVEAAQFFGVDGVIVTGAATGKPASLDDLARARAVSDVPVLVGSGVTPEAVPELFRHAHALIVGTWIKAGGHWASPVDPDRARALVRARG